MPAPYPVIGLDTHSILATAPFDEHRAPGIEPYIRQEKHMRFHMHLIARASAWIGAAALAAALGVVPSAVAETSHAQTAGVWQVAAATQSVVVSSDGPGSNHRRSRGGSGLISNHISR
jgi:hypothetical protein